ncbi:MAG: glycosyltransferase family 2 protein [Deltaproteobacteria bacterium]|nr:glycosyltransferase family 2 protein [Deltaproteobacteria bacterium]
MKIFYFIAVNYRNYEFTIKYIKSINRFNFDRANIHIRIVDNDSGPEDLEAIQKATTGLKNFKLIKNEKNLGYFKALNVGIDDVYDKRDCILIVGNNDMEFHENFIAELQKVGYDDKTLVIAPNIITMDGRHQNPHYIARMSRLRKFGFKVYHTSYFLSLCIHWLRGMQKKLRPPKKNDEHTKRQFIHMGVGACYILTEFFFDHYAKLDDSVFLWGEESLLANQIESVNGKILYEPDLIVYHRENGSVSKIPSRTAYKIAKESYKTFSKYL